MQRFRVEMIGAFALLAALLACLGVYAVRSQAVTARVREFGIRSALGATRPQIIRLVIRQTIGQVALGIVIGLAAAATLTRFISQWLASRKTSGVVSWRKGNSTFPS